MLSPFLFLLGKLMRYAPATKIATRLPHANQLVKVNHQSLSYNPPDFSVKESRYNYDLDSLETINAKRKATPIVHKNECFNLKRGFQKYIKLRHEYGLDLRNKYLADIGCGWGDLCLYTSNVLGQRCEGVDVTDDFFKNSVSHLKPPSKFHIAPAEQLPFESNTFDIATSWDAFEHVEDPKKSFNEMIRVVKRGGIVFVHSGGPFYSPLGSHLYYQFSFPWPNVLFKDDVINQWFQRHGYPGNKESFAEKSYNWVNRARPKHFRQMLDQDGIAILHFREGLETNQGKFIERHAERFQSLEKCDYLVTYFDLVAIKL